MSWLPQALPASPHAHQQLRDACCARTPHPGTGAGTAAAGQDVPLLGRTRCGLTFTMGTYSSGGAGWILLDISMTAFTRPVTFSYTLSLERSRLAVGGGLISWG